MTAHEPKNSVHLSSPFSVSSQHTDHHLLDGICQHLSKHCTARQRHHVSNLHLQVLDEPQLVPAALVSSCRRPSAGSTAPLQLAEDLVYPVLHDRLPCAGLLEELLLGLAPLLLQGGSSRAGAACERPRATHVGDWGRQAVAVPSACAVSLSCMYGQCPALASAARRCTILLWPWWMAGLALQCAAP